MREARLSWLGLALALYGVMIGISAWRWRLLLRTQDLDAGLGWLTNSLLVATFFSNFLPSNIGGDVVRIADTVPIAGSKTVATTVILADRALGLLALLVVASSGAWLVHWEGVALPGTQLIGAGALGLATAGVLLLAVPGAAIRLLAPFARLKPGWMEERLARLDTALQRFRRQPGAVFLAFAGALVVQVVLVGFYLAVAYALGIRVPLGRGLVVVPVSLVVQMAPVSINGFGVREAVFSFYFAQFGFGVDAGVALSLVSAALIMLFSLSGGLLFLARRRGSRPSPAGDPA